MPSYWINPANEYTLAQVARLADTHISAVMRAILKKRLPARREGRVYFILGTDAARYLERKAPQ